MRRIPRRATKQCHSSHLPPPPPSNARERAITLKKRAASDKAKRHIHVAWLCIAEDGRRVEDAEIELCSDLAEQMPVLGVITKSRSDAGFRAEVQRLLPEATGVVRVRATAEKMDDGISLPPMGLRDLVDATQELLPEAFQRAFVAAQKVSLEKKERQARNVVMVAAGAATAAGAVPIPFADAALLIPIQIGMFAKVSAAFGFDPTKDFLRVLVATVAGSCAATFAGRAIVWSRTSADTWAKCRSCGWRLTTNRPRRASAESLNTTRSPY